MTHARFPDFSPAGPLAFPGLLPAPATLTVEAPHDPVLAAIEAHAEAWAVFQVAPAGRPSEIAEDAMSAALEDLLATPCLSRFGALALVRHLRWFIREEAVTAETADLCGRVALAREADLSRFIGSDLPPERLPAAEPMGRLAASASRPVPLPPPESQSRIRPRKSGEGASARVAVRACEALAAVALIGGGAVLTGLATLL